MDFNAAMETFAEAWVAANTPTAISNPECQKSKSLAELPTMLPREQITTPSEPEIKSQSPKKVDPNSTQVTNAKSLPIHCVIEQVSGIPSFENVSSQTATLQGSVELDSYAILPNSTLLQDLVRAALLKLGYNSTDAMNAKGAIQIKNWKPLCFDSISDNSQSTIEDILGELTNTATLRIRLASHSRQATADDVKEKLLQLLLTQSQSLLNDSGCPIEKNILASLSKGENLSGCLAEGLSDEMRRAFDQWYSEQLHRSIKPPQVPVIKTDKSPIKKEVSMKEEVVSPGENDQSDSSPSSYRSFLSHKTRIRTSFDPEYEISRLQKWFQDNQHPSRDQMIGYMNELNRLESRKGRRPLDLTNIIYWFKNARAAQRRASKAMDDSFENDENNENGVPENIPYLPNKNAVYVIPFPYHRTVNSLDNHSEEPCDLSMNKRSLPKDIEDDSSLRRGSSEDKQEECGMFEKEAVCDVLTENSKSAREPSDKTVNNVHSSQPLNGISKNLLQNSNHDFLQNMKTEKEENVLNGNKNNNNSVSDSDNYDSQNLERNHDDMNRTDDESDDSEDDSSESNDERRHCIKEEKNDVVMEYSNMGFGGVSSANMSPASIAAMSLAQMSQPLHIPQLPPHLAMAYYPMNARYYMQHANSLQHSPQQPSQHRESSKHSDSRKRRTRVFIDPLTEIPQLERWFEEDTHPSAYMIDKYCEELNSTDYRQKFPRLESKNIQLWFKNHRAKVKRMRLS